MCVCVCTLFRHTWQLVGSFKVKMQVTRLKLMATREEATDKLFLPRKNQHAWVIQELCIDAPKGSLCNVMQKDMMGSDDSSTYLSTCELNSHKHFFRDLIFSTRISYSEDAEKFTVVRWRQLCTKAKKDPLTSCVTQRLCWCRWVKANWQYSSHRTIQNRESDCIKSFKARQNNKSDQTKQGSFPLPLAQPFSLREISCNLVCKCHQPPAKEEETDPGWCEGEPRW